MPAKKTPSRPAGKAPAETTTKPFIDGGASSSVVRIRTTGGPAKRRIDWEAVERDYRTGKKTLRELAAKHGATHTTIGRRAERDGWTKDLTEAIRQATNAKLIEATVQQECTSAHQNATEAVLVAAEIAKGVILGQRARVGQATNVAMRMLAELDTTTTKADEIQALFEVLTDELDDSGKAAAQRQLGEFMRLHSRVASVQKLMDALGKAQTLERQAFALDEPEKPPERPEATDWRAKTAEEAQAAYLRLVRGQ